jgi:hypothetical protein
MKKKVLSPMAEALIIAIAFRKDKLKAIVESLSKHKLLHEVRYGVNGFTFNKIKEILEG